MQTQNHAFSYLGANSGNPVMERLARRQPVTALGVRSARTAEIARLAKSTNHHAVWIDLEHSTMPIDVAGAICSTAQDVGLVPFVRVPEREFGVIGRLLDSGAAGIIMPRIETAEQAADAVAACRFPPEGHRSAIATLPQFGHRRMPPAHLYEAANRSTIVKLLVESPRGIENIEAIARVEGVDLVGIGSNDLSAELGVVGPSVHRLMREAHDAALAACARANKPLVIGGVAEPGYIADCIRRGAAPFLMTGIDTDILMMAMHERVSNALASLSGLLDG
ncbi:MULTISPECIES: aldolase/citrate lyase family protein [unclassified Variovorax]|uniref:aldolase/citrate lyase family protein n=1 Tax=unclassified Variovorax TaxID=663243 RepID=UPI0008B0CEF4|nr:MULTISPECIES: aldolase/citrate lyase family protein [unclassified Variovorax]SEK17303.1 2-keto-3-deoxy-L-rhamnonate aldolase RhmA [Variovorax sp. OK202]SFE78709.1 2-keto-3-deoxy-L-rhamnonate aldolase RhmA [Variovorax sp. OK212]